MKAFWTSLAVLVAAVWLGWRLMYPSFDWHQKLTITVETPSGEVAGSSVSAMQVWTGPKTLPEAPTIGFELTAEAPFVEVAPGRYLFALIGAAAAWAPETYAPTATGQSFKTQMRKVVRQKGEPPVPMPREVWPQLVTFDDIVDPTTVRLVDPDDLAATFGPGVRLSAITLELTREAVTVGRVEAVLGWLKAAGERGTLKGAPPGGWVPGVVSPPIYLVNSSDFSTELYK